MFYFVYHSLVKGSSKKRNPRVAQRTNSRGQEYFGGESRSIQISNVSDKEKSHFSRFSLQLQISILKVAWFLFHPVGSKSLMASGNLCCACSAATSHYTLQFEKHRSTNYSQTKAFLHQWFSNIRLHQQAVNPSLFKN